MSDITTDRLATFLEGKLEPDDGVTVTDLQEHVEGWSRDTASFTARWTADGVPREHRYVVRAESDTQAEGTDEATEGNDIETEYRTMAAAQDAPVPVPTTHWFEPDRSVLGGAFFVVDYCPGDAPVTWDREQRQQLHEKWDSGSDLPSQFVDATVGVHEIDPADVPGLEQIPADEVVERRVDRWVDVYRDAVVAPEPAVEECIRWFRSNAPEIPETSFVHGDFRIGNMLVDDDEITGVLDWELAHVGDYHYDLGYASLHYFAGKLVEPTERPELACGIVDREWFYEEYERRSGRPVDPERLRYWQAFGAFVMMTIGLAGVDRYRRGESDDVRSAWFQYIVPGLVEDMLALVREDRV